MLCNKIHCCVGKTCLNHFSSTACLLGALEYLGKDTVVAVCVWDLTVSGTHPVGCELGRVSCVGSSSHPFHRYPAKIVACDLLDDVKSFVAILINDGAQV